MSSPELPPEDLPPTTLDQLSQRLRDACGRAGWDELMPVQARAIPYLFARRDVMVQSRTGSGKTGAFLLPMLERIDPRRAACQALVLVPTRELAKQVEREASILADGSGIHTVAVYGGTAYGPQRDAFEMLVLDEADRMLSMGFYPDMQRVRGYLPARGVNGALFSATFPAHVVGLAREFLRRPETLSLSKDHVHVTDVEHTSYVVPGAEKDRCLVRILEYENPDAAIVFCNRKRTVHFVNVVLQRFGWDADELSSDLSQDHRERVLQRVRDGTLRVLVATDVAARGIDIPDLSHVFMYEPPEDPESYIHRAGRTGRAGASGRAVSLVAKNTIEVVELTRIAKEYEIDLHEQAVPTDEEVAEILAQRITARLEAEVRGRDDAARARLDALVPLARRLSASEAGAGFLAMLLDDALHRPPAEARPPVAEDEAPIDLARRLLPALQSSFLARDQIQLERLLRLVPLARRLGEIDDECVLLALLLEDEGSRALARSRRRSAGPPRRR